MSAFDRASRSPRFATLYCPHCGAELDNVPTDRELAQDYACPHCGRHSRAYVHANRCWYVVAL
jgi:predicted RNA-binding Zn-ribbon protein involved in translation (DUF1610 family)